MLLRSSAVVVAVAALSTGCVAARSVRAGRMPGRLVPVEATAFSDEVEDSAGASRDEPNPPPASVIPIAAVTEQQDEWLHDYCTPRKLVSAVSIADADRQIRASEGNFGEVVYETSSMQIVAFACPGTPTWTVASRLEPATTPYR